MARAVLVVEQAGPLTTIQDAGRFGHLRHGVTWSGPVEPLGFAAAQAALGNPVTTPAIELSHGGIALHCIEGEVRFALAGGDFTASHNGRALGPWTTAVLTAGSRLVVRDGKDGNWATLAFAGHIDCPAWLGSHATLALAGLGGGRLAAGDRLIIEADAVGHSDVRAIAAPAPETGPIRVVIGPQQEHFAAETLAMLLATPFAASRAFDRMGMGLEGPPLPPLALTMLSTPVIRGAIQVNGAGVATILLADHQTTAGYPRIATVISADLPRAAQARPGTQLRFTAISAAQAVVIARSAAAAHNARLAAAADTRSLAERLFGSNLIDGVVAAGSD